MRTPFSDTLCWFVNDHLAVDYFRAAPTRSDRVAITFTSWGHSTLDGTGYGGDFLLSEGYDVVAFKLTENNWYQTVPLSLLSEVDSRLRAMGYPHRIGYGSSMGGYAAIQFSKHLQLSRVLAYSPQYRIDQPFDTGWADWAKKISFKHHITSTSISPYCHYDLVYDPHTLEREHIARFARYIQANKLSTHMIRWVGHPADTYLSEVDLLKAVSRRLLHGKTLHGVDMKERKGTSKTYLFQLSLSLSRRNKNYAALTLIERALALDGARTDFRQHHEALCERLGISARAQDSATPVQAVSRSYDVATQNEAADQVAFHADQGATLDGLGRYKEAALSIRKALSIAYQAPRSNALSNVPLRDLHARLSYLLVKLNQPHAALSEINAAINIDDSMASHHWHRSALLADMGDLRAALTAIDRALELEPGHPDYLGYLRQLRAR